MIDTARTSTLAGGSRGKQLYGSPDGGVWCLSTDANDKFGTDCLGFSQGKVYYWAWLIEERIPESWGLDWIG